jgi:hypothetical protein
MVTGIVPNQIEAVDLKVGNHMRTVQVRNNSFSVRAAVPILIVHLERRPAGHGDGSPRKRRG